MASEVKMKEITVCVVGNVDAGKSTTVGVLTSNALDDGKGLARGAVFKHKHEQESGRTSDIAHQYYTDKENSKIITYVDLAGHEKYLRTTISGLTSTRADLCLVCISDKITKMTKEHIQLVSLLQMPIVCVLTKIDSVPKDVRETVLRQIISLMRSKYKPYIVRNLEDVAILHQNGINEGAKFIPIVMTSNKTGEGLPLLRALINVYDKKVCAAEDKHAAKGFYVEHIYYNVKGHGVVLVGYADETISLGDTLFMGPIKHNKYIPVKVKSIHNDYRTPMTELKDGQKGCINITLDKSDKRYLHKGLILSRVNDMPSYKTFLAEIMVLQHSTTICAGYQSYMHCGPIGENVRVLEIVGQDNTLRAGDRAMIKFEFIKNSYNLEKNKTFILREGRVRVKGLIKEFYEKS